MSKNFKDLKVGDKLYVFDYARSVKYPNLMLLEAEIRDIKLENGICTFTCYTPGVIQDYSVENILESQYISNDKFGFFTDKEDSINYANKFVLNKIADLIADNFSISKKKEENKREIEKLMEARNVMATTFIN